MLESPLVIMTYVSKTLIVMPVIKAYPMTMCGWLMLQKFNFVRHDRLWCYFEYGFVVIVSCLYELF